MTDPVITLALSCALISAGPQPVHILVDTAAASREGVAASLADAIKAAAEAPIGTSQIDIEIKSGGLAVREPVHIDKLPAPVRIRGGGAGARLIGGAVFRDTPRPLELNDPARDRIPAGAVGDVRFVDLKSAWAADGPWAGRSTLAGPARHGMGLPPGAGSELFLDGHPLVTARWPNDGFAGIAGVVDAGTSKESIKPGDAPRAGTFRVADREKLETWAAAKDVWLSGYWRWDWADDEMPAGKIDAAAGTIALGFPHSYGLAAAARFRVTNIPEELDAPGEYWIDVVNARAYFRPPEGAETGGDHELMVSLLGEPMITLDGTSDVEISNLDFEGGRGVAIRANGAAKVRIEHCTFRNMGTGAVEIDGRACSVRACVFEDIGAAGVSISGGDRATLTHAGNEVRDCTFRRCARTHRSYQPAIRVEGVGQIIANNLIERLPHCAVIFAGNEHIIEFNDISNVLTETGDSGAIYCGRDWTLHGTVIRHNLFHDIQGTDARYQNAVYLDDMASGIAVEGNIFVRCNWGSLIGGGRDVRFTGNVLDSCRKGLSFDARGVNWMAKNIADPEHSTLHQRLRAVPIDHEPWSTRYPTLRNYLTDRFGRPVGGVVSANMFFATPLGRIDDRECVMLDTNAESKTALPVAEVSGILDPVRRRELPDLAPDGAPEGFKPIPVSRIGPSTTR